MKIRNLVIILLAFTSATTFAQNNEVVRILPSEEGMVRLLITEHKNEPVIVKFKKGNQVISKDKIRTANKENGFIKLYDINNLYAGEYQLEVLNAGKITTYNFSTKNGQPVWTQYWNDKLNNDTQIAKLDKEDSLALTKGN